LLTHPISVVGIAISGIVAIAVIVEVTRLSSSRTTRSTAIAVVSLGFFGGLVGAGFAEAVISWADPVSNFDLLAGSLCGFTWTAVLALAATRGRMSPRTTTALATVSTSSLVLYIFATIFAFLALPMLLVAFRSNEGFGIDRVCFVVPGAIAFGLWKLGKRRA